LIVVGVSGGELIQVVRSDELKRKLMLRSRVLVTHVKLRRLIDPATDFPLFLLAASRLLGNVIEPSRFEQDSGMRQDKRRWVRNRGSTATEGIHVPIDAHSAASQSTFAVERRKIGSIRNIKRINGDSKRFSATNKHAEMSQKWSKGNGTFRTTIIVKES